MKKILIVEDEPDVRVLLKRRLAASQFEAIEAEDGLVGVEQALSQNPDLIVLDLMLPGKDGFQVYEQLRSEDATKNTPVLFLTALSQGNTLTKQGLGLMASSKYQVALEGNYDVMGKPYDPKALVAKIEEMLAG